MNLVKRIPKEFVISSTPLNPFCCVRLLSTIEPSLSIYPARRAIKTHALYRILLQFVTLSFPLLFSVSSFPFPIIFMRPVSFPFPSTSYSSYTSLQSFFSVWSSYQFFVCLAQSIFSKSVGFLSKCTLCLAVPLFLRKLGSKALRQF